MLHHIRSLPSFEKRLLRLLLVLAFTVLTGFITSMLPEDIEPRSVLAQVLFQGVIPFGLIVLLFTGGAGYVFWQIGYGFRRARQVSEQLGWLLLGLVVSAVALAIGSFFLFLLMLFIRDFGTFNRDVVVYHDSREPSHKLIGQYYEIGTPGNPHYRLIEVWNEHAAFRRFRPVAADAVQGHIPEFTPGPAATADARVLYQGRTFYLERQQAE